MTKVQRLILAILSGVLLALPWYEQFSGIIIFVAFIPMFLLEDDIFKSLNKNKYFIIIAYGSISFGLWNLLTTFWIYHATVVGMFAAVLVNTFLMTCIFLAFHFTKTKLGSKIGYISFIVFWISFEYIYLNAEISWPWLNLGNAFSKDIKIIQWYEYTGSLGGTLWILLVNFMGFHSIKKVLKSGSIRPVIPSIIIFFIFIFIPLFISFSIYRNYKEQGEKINIAVLQPNINPYTEKFNGLSENQQLKIVLDLADSISSDTLDYIVGPETIFGSVWINSINQNKSIKMIQNFVNKHSNISFVFGIDCFKKYYKNEKLTPTARYYKSEKDSFYYDAFNSAIQIDTSRFIPIYHKSKLVTGVEKMPFPRWLKGLERFIIDLGGTTGSRGTQNYRGVFKHIRHETRIAPVICYESVYGEFVSDYVKNGANLIFIITNDGWWGNSPGYKQHLHYASLRAIETRRSIARSANTGISAFINQKGEIIKSTDWWKKDAIKCTLKANKEFTFYVKYGDYIGRLSSFLAFFLFLYAIVQHLLNRSILKTENFS